MLHHALLTLHVQIFNHITTKWEIVIKQRLKQFHTFSNWCQEDFWQLNKMLQVVFVKKKKMLARMNIYVHWLIFLFGIIFNCGFISGADLDINIHSTRRALWAHLAEGYVSAWRPSVIPPCLSLQKWDGSLLMSGRDSYSWLFLTDSHQSSLLPCLLQGVRECFLFSDQSNLQVHSLTVLDKRSLDIVYHHCF